MTDPGSLQHVSREGGRFSGPRGLIFTPYVEVGAGYEFERPNDGKIRARGLSLVETSPWSGQVTVAIRTLVTSSVFIDLRGSSLSIGQNDLNVWSAGLFLSYGF